MPPDSVHDAVRRTRRSTTTRRSDSWTALAAMDADERPVGKRRRRLKAALPEPCGTRPRVHRARPAGRCTSSAPSRTMKRPSTRTCVAPVRSEHEPGDRIRDVGEIVAGKDRDVGARPGVSGRDRRGRRTRARLRCERECIARREDVGPDRALPSRVQRLAHLAEEPADLVGRRAVDSEADRAPGGRQVGDPAHAGAESSVRRRAVRDAGAGGTEARDLGVVEVDAVRDPDVGRDPAPRIEQFGRARPKRSRQSACSSSVSARCVCRRRPRARASSAEASINSGVTENGEHGATTTVTMSPS